MNQHEQRAEALAANLYAVLVIFNTAAFIAGGVFTYLIFIK